MQAHTKRDERMLARVGKEPPARFADQRGRRQLVGAGAGLIGLLWIDAAVCWALAPSDTAMFTTLAVMAVTVLAGAWVWGTLFLSTRGTVGLPEHLLDERQLKERLRAHAMAHRLTLLLVFITYFAVSLAGEFPAAALTVLFFSLLATIWALPMLVAAWRMTDPPADD